MITDILKIFRYGNSKAMMLPKSIVSSKYATAACENLILADPTGIIPEHKLVEWVRDIENKRVEWLKERNENEK